MGGGVQVHMPSTIRATEPFRLLFAGQALSVVGDRMMAVAIAFAVLAIGDATDLGIVLAASGIPFALFAVVGGVLSDRVGRRRTMIASDVIRTICQAAVAALLLTGTAEIWMLVVASAVYGAGAAIFMPALMGLIPQTVPPDRLQEANALLGFTRRAANVAGPAGAGVGLALGDPARPPAGGKRRARLHAQRGDRRGPGGRGRRHRAGRSGHRHRDRRIHVRRQRGVPDRAAPGAARGGGRPRRRRGLPRPPAHG